MSFDGISLGLRIIQAFGRDSQEAKFYMKLSDEFCRTGIWISVDDKMPEYYMDVFMRCRDGFYYCYGFFGKGDGWMNKSDIKRDMNDFPVTHWQSMPPIPEAK